MNEHKAQIRYDRLAMALHWLVAFLMVLVGLLGLIYDGFPRAQRMFYLNLHTTLGLVMFGLILLRVLWRIARPALPPDPAWSPLVVFTSNLAHKALYALMIATPLVGIMAYIWHGRVFNFGFFQLDAGLGSVKWIYEPAEEIHEFLAFSLMGLVGLHIVGALWHHFVARDGIFRRILPH